MPLGGRKLLTLRFAKQEPLDGEQTQAHDACVSFRIGVAAAAVSAVVVDADGTEYVHFPAEKAPLFLIAI